MSLSIKKGVGFTLMEIIVVLGIVSVILSISVGIYFSLRKETGVDTDAQKIASSIRLAQNRTLTAREFSKHGVHFDTTAGTYTIFSGDTFDPGDPSNEVEYLESSVEFLNTQLSGGGTEVVFDRLSGHTQNSGFVEISRVGDADIKNTICISPTGSITVLGSLADSSQCSSADLEYVEGATNSDLASFPSDSAYGDPAQSFTTGPEELYVSDIDLYVRYNDDDVDSDFSDIFLEIREGGTTGNVIGKSLVVDGSTLPSSLSWVNFTFPYSAQLDPLTTYFMRLRSLPTSTVSSSGAEGTIIWGYDNSPSSPYAGGDAWVFVGANDIPSDDGQQRTQDDFSFRIYSQEGPSVTDSRHMEFDLGFSLRGSTDMTLTFDGTHVETIPIADFMNSNSTSFNWEDTIDVSGNEEHIRIHSMYIDDNDTILSVHRDQDLNDLSLDIEVDGTDIASYTAGGTPVKGLTITSMVYR